MALQTSGQISLKNIADEFGDTAPYSMSEYYGAASGIPASGIISIGNFYGAAAPINYQPITSATSTIINTEYAGGDGAVMYDGTTLRYGQVTGILGNADFTMFNENGSLINTILTNNGQIEASFIAANDRYFLWATKRYRNSACMINIIDVNNNLIWNRSFTASTTINSIDIGRQSVDRIACRYQNSSTNYLKVYNTAGTLLKTTQFGNSGLYTTSVGDVVIGKDRIWAGSHGAYYLGYPGYPNNLSRIYEFDLNGNYIRYFNAPVNASQYDGFGGSMAYDWEEDLYYVHYRDLTNFSTYRGRIAIYNGSGTYLHSFTVPNNQMGYGENAATVGRHKLISASGGYIVVGGANPFVYNQGRVWIYKITNGGTGNTLLYNITSPNAGSYTHFGMSVDSVHLSNGEHRVIATQEDVGSGNNSAYIWS